MATLNGARSLGLGDVTGSLRVGKWADCVAVDLSRPETSPVYNPLTQIVYAAGREQVTDVWVAGRRLLDNRRLTRMDEADVCIRAGRWRDKLVSSSTWGA